MTHARPFDLREYELTVRQEPKQARMCGVGGKGLFASPSSPHHLIRPKIPSFLPHRTPFSQLSFLADRRPIDPPPIVQLRVIDNSVRRPNSSSSRASSPGMFPSPHVHPILQCIMYSLLHLVIPHIAHCD